MVRRYKSVGAYQSDVKNWTARGWEVSSTMEERPRSGCGRVLLLGIFAAVFPPKPVTVVTYVWRPR
jgi:hypothetical protein